METKEKKVSRREFLRASAAAGAVLAAGGVLLSAGGGTGAAAAEPIQLSKPQDAGTSGLTTLLAKRASSREFSPQPLPVAVLSTLLWSAFGINRPDGKRTAPSANNRQDIDIYAILAEGLYLYDPKANALKPVVMEDLRGLAGSQPFVKGAPLNLVYVSDYTKLGGLPEEMRLFYSGAHTGFISQNVYLSCASQGLATVVRAMVDKPVLAKAMKLGPDQRITLVQTVGYPKKGG
jgi:nitroreductase